MHIISASIPALKPMKFTNFKGSSAGSMMGPIILPPMSSMWSLLWPQKKDLFTPANLIPVGGRAGPDDELPEDHSPTKPRDKDTMEPVFFHALPGSFYDEVLSAIPLAGVLDPLSWRWGAGIVLLHEGHLLHGTVLLRFSQEVPFPAPRTQHLACDVGRLEPAV